jgi:hypothetical protein
MNTITNQGWQCPVCKHVYSPVMIECVHCSNPNTGSAAKDGYAMIDFKAKLANDLIKMDINSLKDFRLSLPLLYPSGGWVLIKIKWNDDSFYVCDDWGAWVQANTISALDIFEKHAKEASIKYGVDADSRQIFCAKTTKEELFSKIVQIANASIFAAKNVSDAQDKRKVRAAAETKRKATK